MFTVNVVVGIDTLPVGHASLAVTDLSKAKECALYLFKELSYSCPAANSARITVLTGNGHRRAGKKYRHLSAKYVDSRIYHIGKDQSLIETSNQMDSINKDHQERVDIL
jgi:hypothetical protein